MTTAKITLKMIEPCKVKAEYPYTHDHFHSLFDVAFRIVDFKRSLTTVVGLHRS